MIINIIGHLFIALGVVFCIIAALGTLRFPDLYCRMHAATKAGALGVTLLLIGANCFHTSLRSIVTSLLIIYFFYLTAPIAAHLIGRAAYRDGLKPDPKTKPIEYAP